MRDQKIDRASLLNALTLYEWPICRVSAPAGRVIHTGGSLQGGDESEHLHYARPRRRGSQDPLVDRVDDAEAGPAAQEQPELRRRNCCLIFWRARSTSLH